MGFWNTREKAKRKYVKDVIPGDVININTSWVKGNVAWVTCISNDPQTKTIYVSLKFKQVQEGHINPLPLILKYSSWELENFHLLNAESMYNPNDDDMVAQIKNKMDEYLEKEEYEKAQSLKNKVSKLLIEEKEGK